MASQDMMKRISETKLQLAGSTSGSQILRDRPDISSWDVQIPQLREDLANVRASIQQAWLKLNELQEEQRSSSLK
ncbi:hypothetical protein AAL_03989 [Moelleriella libera RCEF 2490]|uniref:Uncharacterized protein n=1 Tax=Moelleriella libera RCEF 2490 TaxID=1081109 RepID=A0A166PHD7_9HYPO|nr:hypothetical protein AAL_03989 [Moelleriella libera RCEF 2490]